MSVRVVAASEIHLPEIPTGGPREAFPLAKKVTIDFSEWVMELTNYICAISEYNDGLVYKLHMHPDTFQALSVFLGNTLCHNEETHSYHLWSAEICLDKKLPIGVVSTELSKEKYQYDNKETVIKPSGIKSK
jgi:hypothetical protein